MPTWFMIVFPIIVIAGVGRIVWQIRQVQLQKRNLRHWENNEPLEGGVDKWD